jgi:four helix bundle protein
MQEFRFLDWPIYNDTKIAVNLVFSLTHKFPQYFRYELGSQMNRSAISILLNIAEGSGKRSDKDFSHFLNIAHGSLYETIAGFDLAVSNGLVSESQFNDLQTKLLVIAKQLGGFRKKLVGSKFKV